MTGCLSSWDSPDPFACSFGVILSQALGGCFDAAILTSPSETIYQIKGHSLNFIKEVINKRWRAVTARHPIFRTTPTGCFIPLRAYQYDGRGSKVNPSIRLPFPACRRSGLRCFLLQLAR